MYQEQSGKYGQGDKQPVADFEGNEGGLKIEQDGKRSSIRDKTK